ncbi:hypothetical protein P0D84_17600 [Paraburkholderia sp. RL17-337-BIB-A]
MVEIESLVLQSTNDRMSNSLQHHWKVGISTQVDVHRQRIGEEAYGRLFVLVNAPGERCADNNFGLPGVSTKQYTPNGKDGDELLAACKPEQRGKLMLRQFEEGRFAAEIPLRLYVAVVRKGKFL